MILMANKTATIMNTIITILIGLSLSTSFAVASGPIKNSTFLILPFSEPNTTVKKNDLQKEGFRVIKTVPSEQVFYVQSELPAFFAKKLRNQLKKRVKLSTIEAQENTITKPSVNSPELLKLFFNFI
jgi:hypothetical protein